MPTPVFVCAACQKHALHDWSTDEPVPQGWYTRRLDAHGALTEGEGTEFILCENCGHDYLFVPSTSPYLKSLLMLHGAEFS